MNPILIKKNHPKKPLHLKTKLYRALHQNIDRQFFECKFLAESGKIKIIRSKRGCKSSWVELISKILQS